jgi:uncharacterized protein (DUF1697 family)
VALLRGVNVGKAQRVPMEVLRALLSDMGCTQVKTLLNSGNAVFVAPGPATAARALALAAGLSRALHARLGLDVPVVVKSARSWGAIVAGNPLASAPGVAAPDPSRLMVAVAQDAAQLQALKTIEAQVSPPETFHIGADAAYLHCASGILESQAAKALLGRAGRAVTTRNWATTLKIHALCASAT